MFMFPNPVNEVSARIVAGGVVVIAAVALFTGWHWLLALLAIGFVLRVIAGPRFSPLGLLATKVITPRLPAEPKLVAGPPKQFAQALGFVFSATAAVLALGFGQIAASNIALGLLIAAATLESVFALCLGCQIFARLMRAGLIPQSVCEQCNNINLRTHQA